MHVRVESSELTRLQKRLNAVWEIAKNPMIVSAALAKGVVQQVQARFDYEKTSPDGVKWRPWSTAYAATRDSGDSLLIGSEDLRNSIDYRANRTGFAVFSENVYAGAHQFGRPEINLPARPFMGMSTENVQNIDAWLASVMIGAIKGIPVKQTTRAPMKGRRKK